MAQSPKSGRISRSDFFLVLPIILAGVVIVVVPIGLVFPGSPIYMNSSQLTIVSTTSLILTVLCPLMMCMAVPYAVLIFVILMIQRAYVGVENTLEQAHSMTQTAKTHTQDMRTEIDQRTENLKDRLNFLGLLLNYFNDEDKVEHD